MKHRTPRSTNDCLPRLLPLFLLIGTLPVLTHWLRAQLPPDPTVDPGAGACATCPTASCLNAEWEVDVVTATQTKCGYPEFTSETLLPSNIVTNSAGDWIVTGPPVFYLTWIERHRLANYYFVATAGGAAGWFNYAWSASEWLSNEAGSYDATLIKNPTNCSLASAQYAGSYSAYWESKLLGGWGMGWGYENGQQDFPASTETNLYVTTVTNAATGDWDSYPPPTFGLPVPPGVRVVTHTSDLTTLSTNWIYNDGYPPDPYPPNPMGYVENAEYPTYYYDTNFYSGTNHTTLTNEYTDDLAKSLALGKLGPFGGSWTTNEAKLAELKMQDYDSVGTTNYNFNALPGATAEARKFRLRCVFNSETNTNYKIEWTVNYTGSGTNRSYSTNYVEVMPGTGDQIIKECGEFVPSLAYPKIEVTATKCGEVVVTASGAGQPKNSSLGLELGLGSAGHSKAAGTLAIHQERPSAAIATPASLQFVGLTNDVETIYDGSGWLRQAKAPQTLADVVTLTNNAYEVRFYAATNAGVLTNGLYVPTGSPFVVWGISGSTNTNFFRITETRGAGVTTNDFEWAETNQSWTLTSGNGLRREVRSEVWSSTNTVRTITRSILRPSDNALIAKSVEVSQVFPFGLKPTATSIGDGAATRTTTYTYYTSAANDGDNYGKLKTVVNPDGSWQWHEYNSAKRLAKTFSAFQNQSPTNSAALCRVTEFSYAPVGTGDDGTVQSWQPRTTVEKLLDTEIGRSYAVYKTNETSLIKCQTAGSAWDAADNLVTTSTTYSTGSFKGWTKSERRPDGTMSLHEYSVDGSGNLSTIVYSGQPNGAGTAIIAGTKLVTLQGPLGNVIERTTVDIASDIITGSETFSDFDEFGRPGRVTYLDSTFKLFSYLCCGLESETDRDGVTTLYSYDALKRRIATSRNGIAHLNTLDAAGRTLFTERQGTNASTITLASMVYDTAGRLLCQTNAVGNLTSFGESVDGSGQTVKTTTNALGGTRIETYFKDGSLKSVTGTAVHGVRYDYGVESDLPYTKEIKLLTNGTDSGEWTKTFTDIAGRSFKTVYPDDAYTQSYFNNAGQLWKQRDADGVVTLYAYNGEGQMEYSVLDMDRNDTIDFAGTDRITRTVRDVVAAHSTNVRRTRSYVWTTDSSTNSLLTSTVEAAVDGTRTWQTAFGLTSQSVSLCGGTCAATNIAHDGSYTTSLKTDGYLTSVTRYDAQGNQLGATTFTYDEHGRQKTVTDARNGTTTFIYDDADRRVSVTTPIPATGQSAQTTTTYFDDLGRVWKTVQPDGTSVTNEYHLTGEPKKTYGSRVYPEERTYDHAGRMKTLKTWQNFATDTGAAVTTWNYHTTRGWLISKQYADSQGPSYTYSAAGRLASRTWARGVVTTNTYDNAGQLATVDYSDSTPDVGFFYDRRGRQTWATNANDAITYVHNDAGQLLAEVHGTGVLDGLVVTNTYDHLLRRTNLSSFNASTLLTTSTYGFDYASRLATVSDGTNSAHYSYLANSALVESIAFKQSGTTRMTTTKSYDYVNRLTSIVSTPSADTAVSFTYQNNDANQRTRVDATDGSYWIYQYDSLGQVKSAKRYWADGTVVAGQQFEYGFDDIGNRKTAASGGSQFGTSLRTNTYSANLLNQYTNRTLVGYVEVLGSANSNATVTVNNESTYRKGDYFRKELSANNTSAAVWLGITNVAVLNGAGTNGTDIVTTKTGNLLVPKTPEAFSYDADGNTVQDGRWNYSWDGENRLTRLESLTNAQNASRLRLDFAYDHQFRRVQKVVSTWSGSAYVTQSTNRFLYGGWNLTAILDGSGNLLQSFHWGTDLSGSPQNAGGVGGLLSMTVHQGTNAGTYFYCYDGNGNVAALVGAASGAMVARYEYGPFGELLRATGPLAFVNPFRFSTKFCDDEAGFYYYGYRFYDPSTGRWPSRDPLQERGGVNLYAFLHNAAISQIDFLGLADCNSKKDVGNFSLIKLRIRYTRVGGGAIVDWMDAPEWVVNNQPIAKWITIIALGSADIVISSGVPFSIHLQIVFQCCICIDKTTGEVAWSLPKFAAKTVEKSNGDTDYTLKEGAVDYKAGSESMKTDFERTRDELISDAQARCKRQGQHSVTPPSRK
jgi:RHS repeat-associated protein